MTNPPPLPSDQPNATSSPSPITNQPARRSRPLRNIVIALVLVAVAGLIAFVATCPSESQLREKFYGELPGNYKKILEVADGASAMFGGPRLVYHNHVVYSTLEYRSSDGEESRIAYGVFGRTELTPKVNDVKKMVLAFTQ